MSQKLSRISVSFRPARASQCDPVSKNEQQAKHRSMGRRVTGRLTYNCFLLLKWDSRYCSPLYREHDARAAALLSSLAEKVVFRGRQGVCPQSWMLSHEAVYHPHTFFYLYSVFSYCLPLNQQNRHTGRPDRPASVCVMEAKESELVVLCGLWLTALISEGRKWHSNKSTGWTHLPAFI